MKSLANSPLVKSGKTARRPSTKQGVSAVLKGALVIMPLRNAVRVGVRIVDRRQDAAVTSHGQITRAAAPKRGLV